MLVCSMLMSLNLPFDVIIEKYRRSFIWEFLVFLYKVFKKVQYYSCTKYA